MFSIYITKRNIHRRQKILSAPLRVRVNQVIITPRRDRSRKQNLYFQNYFSSKLKRKPAVLKYLGFKERFRKVPYSVRISVNSRPNRKNKTVFSNFSCVVLR